MGRLQDLVPDLGEPLQQEYLPRISERLERDNAALLEYYVQDTLNMDEDGRVDWGAFGTVDFDSYRPQFDKFRYKAEKLKEKLKDLVIMLQIVSARIPGKNKLKILRQARKGLLDIGDIGDCKMYFLAEMYLRAWRMREELDRLVVKRRQRR